MRSPAGDSLASAGSQPGAERAWPTPGSVVGRGRALARVRVLRFAFVGSTCALVQLSVLHALVLAGVQENLANLLAFGVSVEVNFALSQLITWRDRWRAGLGLRTLASRLVMFNGSAATSGLINQGVFGLLNLAIWYLPAAAAGIAAAATANFLLNDRVVFRLRRSRRLPASGAPPEP